MNKIPNPNYPLPEKWYVQRTLNNAEKLNSLLNELFEGTGKNFQGGLQPRHYKKWNGEPTGKHFIHNIFSDSCVKYAPLVGHTEVTYEDLWLASMIPEEWYCIDAPLALLNRWRELNKVIELWGINRYLVLSKHQRDNSYYWAGNLPELKKLEYYNDYKEISLEDFTTLLDILEKKKYARPMETKKEEVYPITLGLFEKLTQAACGSWKIKLHKYLQENLNVEKGLVDIGEHFVEEMLKAATIHNGIDQRKVLKEVFPHTKPDPYKVFKDAEKEGKTVQCLNDYGRWMTDTGKWSYNYPPENYRIKHKHQDLIDEWEASGKTKLVEYLNSDNEWIVVFEPSWNEYVEYRFKPEPKYVPFTFEDAEQLIGKPIKIHRGVFLIISVYNDCIKIGNAGSSIMSYRQLLTNGKFLDGSPCGKLIEN